MRTVSTLCASGAGIGIAGLGLVVVREESPTEQQPALYPTPSNSQSAMTAVAAFHQPSLNSPFAFSTQQTPRSVSEGLNGKTGSSSARVGQKRTLTPRTSFSMMGAERAPERVAEREDGSASRAGTPNARPRSWMRRLSSSMSNSRDSSHTPISRPGSSTLSYSNGSMAFSHAGSTTPMLPDSTPPPLPPNKLVKRSSSFRSSTSSPLLSSGSKLPIPVFRRPATSHQRSVTLQERYSGVNDSDRMSIDGSPSDARDPQRSLYFVPRIAADDLAAMRRRSSSGIPNPIKRVYPNLKYPDRKYKPVLMSARENIKRPDAEVDDGVGIEDERDGLTRMSMTPGVVASSPIPVTSQSEGDQTARRSFSIGDFLPTGPQQPLWRRSSQSRGKTSGSRLVRKTRPRVVSAPQDAMGSNLSRTTGSESERPAKRRDLTDPQTVHRSIYSSASSNKPTDSDPTLEIELNLGAETPQSLYEKRFASKTAEVAHHPTSSPFEQRRLPSANHVSALAKTARLSAAQSEITIDSDSEYRSIGDGSTDYQSDTVYDSYNTRTTRSSSGRRGPHIETIFDESPPEYSSERSSTMLMDILDNGPMPDLQYGKQYRHSTIEEEGSMLSTPVRSLNEKSVTSTPSARPGAPQLFMSSPPALPTMPDPDEIDWDAEDEGDGVDHSMDDTSGDSWPQEKSLAFRFGPALKQSLGASVSGTPLRANTALNDRANLFDWSEVQPSPSQNHSPPRPRTVHGKKDPESRGGRSTGRRAPSNMHARSHSVPVVPDTDGKRNNVVANKFGTWGVGSKGVTEDWNEDFDFDEDDAPDPIPEDITQDTRRIDSGHAMFVPKSIREQQENVVANISLLREWGLLIEELKELRIRAVALDMMDGPYAQAFQEVDAMIELADQETEEDTLQPRRSPPSSPGFDYNDFDEPMPNISEHTELDQFADDQAAPSGNENDSQDMPMRPSTPPHTLTGRPRKDSEAVARTVIQALQSKRSVSDPTATRLAGAQSKKVPFDTATLRHIVPYVKDLKRKVKDALRETEGLYMTPRARTSVNLHRLRDDDDEEPAFRSIFNDPPSGSPLRRRLSRREQAITDHDGAEGASPDQRGDLAARMQGLDLPE